ncbi:hypothetical protein FS749_009695 [Ceratobasidium sp. UAMH 11750]|nr:hypothetical protein FS749_009695 [Ceratobasidium sp. UAMH 11750]
MKPLQVLVIGILISSGALSRDFCTASQKCWPSLDIWSTFNASINGRLVAPRPPAWPCHDPNYDEAACLDAKANWNNSFWRSDQVGAMQDPIWESLGCEIDTPRNKTCKQGFVPTYSVAAQEASDVSKAVAFAAKHRFRLVIKNTGHDYLGRSSGAGSLSIWTHLLKGMNFTDSFVADGCKKVPGIPAVTVGAGEQWRDVYKAADDHNVTIVGGAAPTVGAAGGWLQGGGHGPLASMYGMGVDNALQFTVAKADGKVVVANACRNKGLFWALRGGGGSTYGVILEVTYKTHPALDSIVGLGFNANVTSTRQLTEQALHPTFISFFLPTHTGVRGYAIWPSPTSFAFIVIHPNSPDVASPNATLQPMFDWVSNHPETQALSGGSVHSTFYSFFTTLIQDLGMTTPIWIGGRLVSRDALINNSAKLADLAVNLPPYAGRIINIIGGGVINKIDPESTGLNPQWRKDALVSWNPTSSWTGSTPKDKIELYKSTVTNITQELGKIAGLDHAAYLNEADPEEPQWKRAFFGAHYARLLKIKRQVDPEGVFTCNRCVGSDL